MLAEFGIWLYQFLIVALFNLDDFVYNFQKLLVKKAFLFFCFGSLVVLDVVFLYLLLCLLYINTKISKKRCLMLD